MASNEQHLPPNIKMADEAPSAPPAPPADASAAAVAQPQTDASGHRANRGNFRGGGRGNGRGNGRGGRGGGNKAMGKKFDLDKRQQIQDNRTAKRRKLIDGENDGNSYMSIPFSAEEIAAEERKPKRKVAVLIGYAGTGYHGLQINHKEKTIEGDIFAAFVAAGAISKANADDPKKSSLVRCARTDKGVHAAGNVLSLKLIVEDPDIVDKINQHLPDQIRIWGIQRTMGSFNSHQFCDSRWYEYLMPSYSLLPPHPESFLGKKIAESAKEKGVYDEYVERLDEVSDFWDEVEKNDIQPILERMEPDVRAEVLRKLHELVDQELSDDRKEVEVGQKEDVKIEDTATEQPSVESTAVTEQPKVEEAPQATVDAEAKPAAADGQTEAAQEAKPEKELTPVDLGLREVKAAYVAAKRRYRVTPARLERLQKALDLYVGTNNFHNYTILKRANDPSAKRHIKSFQVNGAPIEIRDTEWISLKIHGQSFMMHQIRKMVAMAVMIVRSGAPQELINESYQSRRISIPKAPGLGLLLERPMFVGYNGKATGANREAIDFAKYEDKIQKFKDEQIYKRMFDVEEKENSFHLFFNQVDNFRTDYFLWVTAGGVQASLERSDRTAERIPKQLQNELGNDPDGVEEVGT
ncbi:pseudouridine synthase [Apodospora peruviana]|uniref:tRNA pseudouridine synthase 1 n=1 Tax=Apodospora peruviana TaxID=516989 RepID=A0AAE0IDF5_9PEZI|nr:pseudouridine synthase [Apodospora peruviana]